MNKKIFVSAFVLGLVIFTFTICLANDGSVGQDLGNSVRDVVDGVGNASKDAINAVGDGMNNMGQQGDNNRTSKDTNNGTNDNGYNAQRTATGTTTGDSTFMGMTGTTWTWLIIGIATIAIIALVWYYSAQTASRQEEHDNRL